MRNLTHVFTKIQHGRNGALAIHNTARANCVAHTLIDAIFQRDVHIIGIGLQPADAHAVHHIFGTVKGAAAICSCRDFGRQFVGGNKPLYDLLGHIQIMRIVIRECDFDFSKFWHAENIAHQFLGKADGTSANDGNFKCHVNSP